MSTIDTLRVRRADYARFLLLTSASRRAGWETDAQPATDVSLEDARAYARWAHKRIPTEGEWSHAATAGFLEDAPGVWEWTETPREGKSEGARIVRGGKYRDRADQEAQLENRSWEDAGARDIGFRCIGDDAELSRADAVVRVDQAVRSLVDEFGPAELALTRGDAPDPEATARLHADLTWHVAIPSGRMESYYAIVLERDRNRVVVFHTNTDAGALALSNVTREATILPLDAMAALRFSLPDALAAVLRAHKPLVIGLT